MAFEKRSSEILFENIWFNLSSSYSLSDEVKWIDLTHKTLKFKLSLWIVRLIQYDLGT